MAKRVAVVGAGCSGLAAIKCCLEEDLLPTCFESASDIGGLWNFTDEVTDKRGSVMSSTIINTSKEMMAFSDFPAPKEFPNFMPHLKVLEYFRLYAERFRLQQYIRFNIEVVSIKKVEGIRPYKLQVCSQHSTNYANTRTECHRSNTNAGSQCSRVNIHAESRSCTDNIGIRSQCLRDNMDAESKNTAHDHTSDSCRGFCRCKGSCTNADLDKVHSDYMESPAVTQKETSNGCSSNARPSATPNVDDPGMLNTAGAAPAQPHLWEIRVKDKITESVSVHYFDCVLICSGHHADITMPYFPGQSIFKGRICHSRDLRQTNEVAGSRHVVVGIGNSGCDTAVVLSGAGKVYLSTRRGTWLMQRLQKYGLPADVVYMSRLVFAIALRLPTWMLNKLAESHLNKAVDHTLYGLRPKHGPFATHPTVNDELPNRIACGHVIMKPNIDSFTESGVRFEDGTVADDIDTVVMATGYKIDFPFLDQSILEVKGNQCPLYLYMFPPTVTPPTLAVIGCVQAEGAVVPVAEMQCRLAARVFKHDAQFPSQRQMLRDMVARKRAMEARYIHTQRHTIQVDFLPYMDELAGAVGCQPKIGRLLFRDPRLALTCLFGPCTAYQYRLMGPHAWSGSRDAIMTQMDRIRFPFSTRLVNERTKAVPFSRCVLTLNIVFLALCIYFVHSFF